MAVMNVVSLPLPYSGSAQAVPRERLENMPAFPADFETGPVRRNNFLNSSTVTRLFEGKVQGSEGISSPDGGSTLFLLDKFGWLHEAVKKPGSGDFTLRERIAYTGPGRPLGFKAVSANRIIVCDCLKGLLEVTLDELRSEPARIEVLGNLVHEDGTAIDYANALDVDEATGDVFFTSSATHPVLLGADGYYDTLAACFMVMLNGAAEGRLLRYSRATRKVSVVTSGFWFPNGVALAADGKHVLVVETTRSRVVRVNIATGAQSDFITGIPAYPDGIEKAADGSGYYVALVAPLSPLMTYYPPAVVRTVLANFIPSVKLLARPLGAVIKVSPTGDVVETLMSESGDTVSSISSVLDTTSRLYFGNLNGDYISYYSRP
eukprot:gene13050-20128_t